MTPPAHRTVARPTATGRAAAVDTLATDWEAPTATVSPSNPWERFGWLMAVIWMVFLIYPLMGLLHSTAAVGWIIVGWGAFVTFAVVYVIGFVTGMRSGTPIGEPVGAWPWIAFGLLLGCAAVSIPAIGLTAVSFLPFIMSFASYGLTRLCHWVTNIGGILITALAVFLTPHGIEFASVLVIVALLGVVNTVSTTLIIRSEKAERIALALATSEGREAVARDVHDLIGHSLTVVRLKAQLAQRLIDSDPERAKAEIADIEALTAEAITGVRSTVTGVRTARLTAQLDTTRSTLHAAGIILHLDGTPDALSPAQEITAGWILREATTNILRHSQARHVTVRIEPGSLIIEDDGTGLPHRASIDVSEGNGIRGMRERAAAAGARFDLTPAPTTGIRVEVTW